MTAAISLHYRDRNDEATGRIMPLGLSSGSALPQRAVLPGPPYVSQPDVDNWASFSFRRDSIPSENALTIGLLHLVPRAAGSSRQEANGLDNSRLMFASAWLSDALVELASLREELTAELCDVPSETDPVALLDSARVLLRSLAHIARRPDLAIDRGGRIGIDWDLGPQAMLALSLSNDGSLYYAAIYGAKRSRGKETFAGTLPVLISDLLSQIALNAILG